MKKTASILITLLLFSLNSYSQFGADYSSYGFNFVNDTYNQGLHNWTGSQINNTAKFYIYKQDATNNYALALKPINETLSINYNDAGHMDLNPCSFKINIRIKITQYSGNNDNLSFTLFTGAKKLQLEFTSTGISYINASNISENIAPAATINQWITYSIALNNCNESATLMLENNSANKYTLNLPNNSSPQNINLSASTDSKNVFSSEIDHIFIYSNPIKWWLGPSTTFINDTPAGYKGTTGDRQHFLSLPNGEKLGVNENGGGFVTFTELTPGGPNLDPDPKFGSGGTKTLRAYFHGSDFNPVQAGVSSVTGGHLVKIDNTDTKLIIESFPLHAYTLESFIDNSPLVFPSGETLDVKRELLTKDSDGYDEFGLDMRYELMTELDFSASLENISKPNGISVVKHEAEWEYIRHPSFILQFHEIVEANRPRFQGIPGTNTDLGEMRPKFEFRLNKDLGFEWLLWRDTKNAWQTLHLTTIGDNKEITITASSKPENRFLVFSTSSDPDVKGAVSWFYPESSVNTNSSVQKSRTNKEILSSEDRRNEITINADWRKTNWCRMNLYIRNEGLKAPCNGDPNIYESFRMEALQLFGTPNEILNEVKNYNPTLAINKAELDNSPIIYPNPFSSEITIKGKNLLNEKIKIYSILGIDISNSIKIIARTENELLLKINNLSSGVYFLQIGNTTTKIYKK